MIENLLVNVFDREVANNTLVSLLGESLHKANGFDQNDNELKKYLTIFLKQKIQHTSVIDKKLNDIR